jgi:hypothetical protein
MNCVIQGMKQTIAEKIQTLRHSAQNFVMVDVV